VETSSEGGSWISVEGFSIGGGLSAVMRAAARVAEGVAVVVGDRSVGVDVVCATGRGVELSALTGLTLNCKIGQKINAAISNKIDEEVSTTPRENRVCEG
jgi:hypothetical protein